MEYIAISAVIGLVGAVTLVWELHSLVEATTEYLETKTEYLKARMKKPAEEL